MGCRGYSLIQYVRVFYISSLDVSTTMYACENQDPRLNVTENAHLTGTPFYRVRKPRVLL